jgi:hypothetical protein
MLVLRGGDPPNAHPDFDDPSVQRGADGQGIVSIGLSLDHRETLSRILLQITAAA